MLHRLVDSDHSMIVIERHLDVIAEAGWAIDLGPGGGDADGTSWPQGKPAVTAGSHPGVALAPTPVLVRR